MDFELSEKLANRLLSEIDKESSLATQLAEHRAMHGRMILSSKLFDADALDVLYELCKADGERTLMLQVSALRNILSDPASREIGRMEVLVPGLVAYFADGAIDGWLYRKNKDGVMLPWLIHNIRHMTPIEGQSRTPYVVIDLMANTLRSANSELADDWTSRRGAMMSAIVIYPHDIVDKSIPEMLADQGYFKETEEFKREYEAHAERFMAYQARFGQQFVLRNAAFIVHDKEKSELVRLREGVTAKCVNDEEILERQFEARATSEFWCENGIWSGFDRIPLHCYLYLFHLDLHRNVWAHVQNIVPYHYKPELREKLILPQEHRDLIDILTADMHVLMEDIVEGKSGGTTILCRGAPGLGKTLTAEVYSEVVGKPLYRVHSGQLGTSALSVQENLSEILRRAARWDSILLLDEADVYIRARDNDLQHNAIVAEFLRTLEYFSGLLFMTTNRIDDVDDAILSRCIAIIQYSMPIKEDATRIWKSLAAQFEVDLPDALIDELTRTYPNASGRDIKELLKLTAKFCKGKGIPFSAEAFRQCAVFRGVC
ncbi:MAG: AAA family ATPase [Burkholderiaceae bacterium]